jgi:predicted lipid-binding transport protein (Tim44 family)
MKTRKMLAITSLIALLGLVLVSADAWARASGGGSRGSRSFSAPASPTTPSSPSRSMSQPAAPVSPMAPQRPSFFSGIMGGIAGFALGGLLGSMLFGGMGGLGRGFGGIGLMEILLIGGGIVLLIMFLRRRRAAGMPAPAYAGPGGQTSAYGAMDQGGGTATITPEMPAAQDSDLARGIGHIRSMDATFDPAAVTDTARRMFQGVQQAVTMRDIAWIREHLGNEMYGVLQDQCDRLRTAKRTNRIEKIEIGGADVTEAWQESGQDFVTVRLTGSMLDYTVDDATGNVVEGSQSARADFDEYWTFARPVGPNRWKLSAIQTA